MGFVFGVVFYLPLELYAQQQKTIRANPVTQKATVFISPRTATFLEGSTFEIPVFINTQGGSINALDLEVNFDPKKLEIIRPSGGQSIIAVWVEPPSYSNTKGFVKIVGAIPNGIKTQSGLITTITFRAIASGQATVYISNLTKVLASDGFGSEVETTYDRATYTIMRKPPEDVTVFSETHPYQDSWYNNNSPVINWDKSPQVSDFSFVVDNKPFTIPDNTADTKDSQTSYQNLADGISYFHIKARKKDTWGGTTHFAVRIDTQPPATFTPKIETILDKTQTQNSRGLVSFFTTDGMSGIDHFEIGIVDKNAPAEASPIFVQAESPFLIPGQTTEGSRLIIRAFDRAGNAQDVSTTIAIPYAFTSVLRNNLVLILSILLILILLIIIIHYLVGHHVISHLRKALKIIHQEELQQYQPSQSVYPPQFQPQPPPTYMAPSPQPLPVYSARRPEVPHYAPPDDSPLHR
jgi:hypothetical protein